MTSEGMVPQLLKVRSQYRLQWEKACQVLHNIQICLLWGEFSGSLLQGHLK